MLRRSPLGELLPYHVVSQLQIFLPAVEEGSNLSVGKAQSWDFSTSFYSRFQYETVDSHLQTVFGSIKIALHGHCVNKMT